MKDDNTLKPEDYVEPNCLLCDKPIGTKKNQERIPQQRIIAKFDELMGKKEFNRAEILLKNWLEEARSIGDEAGIFFIYNEMMGYYRKVKKQEEAYDVVKKGIEMIDPLGYSNTVSGATCYTNAGTVYTSFEDYENALKLFEKAKVIYEKNIEGNEYKLAGLYNNFSTCLIGLKDYASANNYFDDAIELLEKIEGGELELALIYLNKIDVILSEYGTDVICPDIDKYLGIAKDYLESDKLERDTYYSFMVDKCIGVYEYFGWFKYAKILKERVKEIDERARLS